MRHAKWVIGQAERDAWFGHMHAAVGIAGDEVQLDEASRQALLDYFGDAATFLMNDWQHGQVGRSPR
jgi:truncated hemoglobin YjbI